MLVKKATFSKFPAAEGMDMLVIPKPMSADVLATNNSTKPCTTSGDGLFAFENISDE